MTRFGPSDIIRHIVSTCISQRRRFTHLAVVLVLLVIADGLVSRYLTLQGLGSEANPFLRRLNGDEFLLVKVFGALVVGALSLDFYRRRPRMALLSTASFVVIYTAIVYWNVCVLVLAGTATV